MIFYLVTARHSYAIEFFLQRWAPEMRKIVQVMPYEAAVRQRDHSPGVYIFTDLERLDRSQEGRVRDLHDHLMENTATENLVLNPPSRALGRYEFLSRLHEAGINDYGVSRLGDMRRPERFPVFLRDELGHGGQEISLLHSQSEFEVAVVSRWLQRTDLDRILVIEFSDTREPGETTFRKYSAFIIGDQVVPRHLFRSGHWVVKQPTLVGAQELEEEERYLATNPHEAQLREVAGIGGFEYGRIDYSVVAGRVQAWEFNTNPVIMSPPERVHPDRLASHRMVARNIAAAFQALDDSHQGATFDHTPYYPKQPFRPPQLSGAGKVRDFFRSVPSIRRVWLLMRSVKKTIRRVGAKGLAYIARLVRPLVMRRLEERFWG
jgi:hypothetical protein